MEETLQRFTEHLVGRLHGPLTLRFILQPLTAIVYAILDGRKDARAGSPPYFWALLTDSEHRREMARSGWKSVGKVFILAVVLDAVYQFITVRWFYPLETLLVAVALAIVPYLLVRGPVGLVLRGRRRGN